MIAPFPVDRGISAIRWAEALYEGGTSETYRRWRAIV
jgi:hypothetical protein